LRPAGAVHCKKLHLVVALVYLEVIMIVILKNF